MSPSLATSPPPTDSDLIEACDVALVKCKAANDTKADLIKEQDAALQQTLNELSALKAKDENILRSPFLWGAVGIVAGLVLGVVIAK